MKVRLTNHTPNPEKAVATAARLCYSASDIDTLQDEMTPERVERLLNIVGSNGHTSTFEHVSFTFAIEGVSRALSHQLVRHRIASYSQQSQRYVKSSEPDYVIPETILNNKKAKEKYDALMKTIWATYEYLVELGIPKEDSRMTLPNAATTKIIVTMNARELLNFFKVRCCSRAQWEIRQMANLMLEEAKKVAPLLFKKAGPSCVALGYCPEGDMSCRQKK